MNRLLSLALISLFGSVACAQPLQTIDGSEQLLSADLLEAVSSLRLEYRECRWPSDDELQNAGVPLGSVPEEVTDGFSAWITRTIRDDYVPEEVANHFVAFRRDFPVVPPVAADYLAVRYQLPLHDVQILDSGISMGVLVVPREAPSARADTDDYVIECAWRFLRLPGERITGISFAGSTLAFGEDGQLQYGKLTCEDRETDAPRAWWHLLFVWTDGSAVFFEYPRLDGTPHPPQAQPDYSVFSRFTPAAAGTPGQ